MRNKILSQNLFQVLREENDILIKIIQESGSLFKVDLLGMNALIMNYYEMIEKVLENKENRYNVIQTICFHGIEVNIKKIKASEINASLLF